MSVARGFGLNGKSLYANVCKPELVWCNFVVDPANGNGLGIRSLKANGYIENVFMHTSATPGSNNGQLNPNPAIGLAQIQFKNCFNYYLGGDVGFVSPLSGTPLTSVVKGNAYVIVSLGTTTLAQWQAVGLTPGVQPTTSNGIAPATVSVGMAFIATATQAIGGTGAVEAASGSGIDHVEIVGDPNQTISNSNVASNSGAIVIVQFFAGGVVTAPTAQSVVGMSFWFDGSSVTVDGL